jgi:hypothetical protein
MDSHDSTFRSTFSDAAFVLFIVSLLFNCCSFHFLLFDLLFDYSVYFSILILELYSMYFDPLNNNHPAVNKHHTADCTIFVLVQEARSFYHHRHGWISGTNFSIRVKQTARHFVLFDILYVVIFSCRGLCHSIFCHSAKSKLMFVGAVLSDNSFLVLLSGATHYHTVILVKRIGSIYAVSNTCRKSSNSSLGRAQCRTTTGERQIIPIPTICVMRDAVLRPDYDMDLLTANIQFMTKFNLIFFLQRQSQQSHEFL